MIFRHKKNNEKQRHIAFLITESSYFLSHRKAIADACLANNWHVTLISKIDPMHSSQLKGINVVNHDMNRASRNVFREFFTLIQVCRRVHSVRPDILHAVGLKPVLYGVFAARIFNFHALCALAGLGYLFISSKPFTQFLRLVIIYWMKIFLRNRRVGVILQNKADMAKLKSYNVVHPDQITLIRGSGVDLEALKPLPFSEGVTVFAVTSRMLGDKGIREIVWAARHLRWRGVEFVVRFFGEPDPGNLSSLTNEQLEAWHAEGVIEWHGYEADVKKIWRDAHVCLLPSYREGLPKAMLEAAACGRPLISTNVPGCADVVTDGVNGFLVPARDWLEIADAMHRLVRSRELCKKMGDAARKKVEINFGLPLVVEQTMAAYEKLSKSDENSVRS